jgi:hypothetical protein
MGEVSAEKLGRRASHGNLPTLERLDEDKPARHLVITSRTSL